ncbi:TlpA family protein disulfide reductase, partial [Flavobacterium proteolyticum]
KNEDSQKFALQFLQLGFKEMGQEKVLQYLDEKYAKIASQCKDDKNKQAFDLRMAGYKALQKGSNAPNIKWVAANGKEFSLKDLKTDKVLVVFWATWCPHCLETMPKINKWAKENQNVSVLAISLDVDFKEYQKKAIEFDQMYHYCDYKQWDSKPVVDYYVYGTPTMILIDKNKIIESKFTSEKELFEYFNNSAN